MGHPLNAPGTLSVAGRHIFFAARRDAEAQRRRGDVLRVDEGALYPALHRLEVRGWLRSEWGVSDNNRRDCEETMTRFAAAALVLTLSAGVSGQNQFDVASVKKVTNNEGILTIDFAPERFEALMPLRQIILTAYDLRDFQLIGGPGWIHSDAFQVIAKTRAKASNAEVRRMLQNLLAERFNLKVHAETKKASAYELVLARSDGRLSPQLRKSEIDCAALGPNPPSVPPSSKAWCGLRGTGPRRITGQGATMSQFARLLTSSAGRLVIDETALPGGYDFEFVWFPDPTDPATPWLGTALEDQLGLKLTSAQRPVEFLVIDQIQPPTPD
jgi:uncharacterized protein (TIGR03435 family)